MRQSCRGTLTNNKRSISARHESRKMERKRRRKILKKKKLPMVKNPDLKE